MTQDEWNSGDHYERYVGRWSRRVAEKFVALLDVPNGARWLEVGSGSGALTSVILRLASPALVRAYDSSPFYVEFVRRHLPDPRVQIELGDALALPEEPASFDASVSGLVLNFLPDPARAVAEQARLVKPGGVVAAYVWDYAGEMQFMRYFWDAAASLDPAARELDEGARFPLCRPEPLRELFLEAGIKDVTVVPIDVETRFRDFDDYWDPFLGGQGPAPGYTVSLPDQKRNELKALLRSQLPFEPNGSIPLIARVWGVKGAV